MGDDSEIVFNLSIFIMILIFLFRYILNKLRKDEEKKIKLTRENVIQNEFIITTLNDINQIKCFYVLISNIIAVFSIFLVIVLIVKLLSIGKRFVENSLFFCLLFVSIYSLNIEN